MPVNNFPGSDRNNNPIYMDGSEATGVTQLGGAAGAIGLLSSSFKRLSDILTAITGTLTTTVSNTVAITAASLPLPTGAAVSSKQPAFGTTGAPSADILTIQGNPSGAAVPMQTKPLGGTPALSSVAASTTSVSGLVANTSRRGCVIVNDSTANLYIAYAATSSVTSYTYTLGPGGTFEMPLPTYTGIISLIWSAANGNARITELI